MSLMYKILCFVNYYKNKNNPMRDYLSKTDFGTMCGIKDKWWYV